MTSDTELIIESLEGSTRLREGTMRAAIEALRLRRGSLGLDIGCGIGDLTLLLADAVGPDGHVTGMDIARPLLDHARQRARHSGSQGEVAFVQGDMSRLPCAWGGYDWAWSVDCVGYPAGDLLPILKGIGRVVRPGGLVALLAWTSQQLLPGHQMLEARLNADCSAYAPFLDAQPPRAHFQRALHWFREAGLVEPTYRSFIGCVQAPVPPEIRHAMTLLFDMLWGGSMAQASSAEIEEYRRLCSPASPDFIVDLPEYCASFTYTMFTGRVAEGD